MTRRWLLAGLITGLILASHWPSRAQIAAAPVAVNENSARAVLTADSIQLRLPLSKPASTAGRAVVWVLSPGGTKSGEISLDLAPGARTVSATLPWPPDEKNKPAEDIGWYRIAYRIESGSAPPAQGIVSIGAVATNLLTLRLALPRNIVAGKPLSVRVYAGNPVTRRGFRGVRLEGTLKYDGDAADAKEVTPNIVHAATTGGAGEAILTYPIKGAPGATATLSVKGTLIRPDGSQIVASIDSDVEVSDRTVIHVETDKPLHKPGEVVHLRALVFDDAGRAAPGTALTLTIKDPQSKSLLEVPLTTNRFGIVSYDWKTTTQLAPGEYGASFELDAASSYTGSGSSTISIQRYDLPEFSVSASLDHGFYLDGQTPQLRIHAGYLFGKPVSSGTVRIVRVEQDRWNRSTGKLEAPEKEQTATLDGNGGAELSLNVQSDFSGLKENEYERLRDLEYRAIVTDASTGRSEPRNFTVRLTRYPVHLYLNKMGGNDREGDYIVNATYADGEPAACKVSLDWMDENSHPTRVVSVNTSRYGLARVHLRYPNAPAGDDDHPRFDLRLTARDPEGRTSIFDDTLTADSPTNIWISTAETLLKPGQNIEATIHGPQGSVIDVDVVSEQGLLAHQQIYMTHGMEPLNVSMADSFRGLATLVAYTMSGGTESDNYSWRGVGGQAFVLYPEDRELKVKLTGLRTSYAPGASVEAGLDVHTATGDAAPSAFGVSVIDTAVEQRAATEEDANQRWFGQSWWQEGYGLAGVTLESLDKLNMTQPVSEDLQLVAAAGLQSNARTGLKLESHDDEAVRNEYSAVMQKALKPLGEAVLAARPARLPANVDAVRALANATGLDSAVLIDPWNSPYQAKVTIEWSDEVLRMTSAGPDKLFGTRDDFTIDVARRNLYAVPGERLTKLLYEATASGQPLPATVDALKQFTRANGLDLNATFDPDGKPFLYQIEVGRRFYQVGVFRHDAPLQPESDLYQPGNEIWRSLSIDYFSHTETLMEQALNLWTAAGKVFPETEAEALQAFSAAGIDFAALRDPIGQSFQLRMAQVMAFTRVEKVTAGASLEAKSTPVTHLYRAIQVLRPATPTTTPATLDVVAQLLHPITEQSGSDLKPEAVDRGTFKGNTGAIGGAVTDQTGAVISNASITVKSADGADVAAVKSLANGTYLAPNLAAGLYTVEVSAKGFMGFVVREVNVSPVSLTIVDVELRVGSANETVTVTAAPAQLSTSSASLGSVTSGFAGTSRKSVAGPGGQASITEQTYTPRLRHVFEETAFWAPSLETSSNGRATIHFNLPDSLTTWKLHALASTADGRIGVLDQTFKTFQPFFVDLDTPQVLTLGDEITLPVNLRNYTAHSLALPVTIKPAAWFTPLTSSTLHANVPSNGSTPVVFGFRAGKIAEAGPLRITAADAHDGDAVEKTVRVHPDGEPRAATTSGLLRGHSTTLKLDLPENAIAGSTHAELLLYPNLGAHVLHAMKAVLERPYGCGEQTISSTYPSLLYLELLKVSRAQNADADLPLEGQAQTYLQLGYDRLLDYFDANGGLTYWGGNDHDVDPALTAYGIEFLSEAGPYIAVDRNRIDSSLNWLLANQQSDGSWKPHYGNTSAELNLYVAEVLAQTLSREVQDKSAPRELQDRIHQAVARATAWAATSAAAVHAPYANALRLRLAEAANDAATAARLRAELASTATRDRGGVHWTPLGYSPFYGWGHAGELETTALVLSALQQANPSATDSALVDDALFFLVQSQDRYGIWSSGQATVRVLQALLPLAIDQMKTPASSQAFQLTINGVPLTPADADALHADPRLLSAPRSLDLTELLKPGSNQLVFTAAGDRSLASAEATASFYTPWQGDPVSSKTQTGTSAGLDFAYTCSATGAQVGSPIDCTVAARRFGSQSYGMLLAEVGLPPGADVDRASLSRLLDNWTISRYELQPDRIVFYLWSSQPAGTHFSFRFTPRYAIRAKAAPAILSDYYNPDLRVLLPPQTFTVSPR